MGNLKDIETEQFLENMEMPVSKIIFNKTHGRG